MSRSVVAVLLLLGVAAVWTWGLPPVLAPWPPPASRAPVATAAPAVPTLHLPRLAAAPAASPAAPGDGRNPFMASVTTRPEVAPAPAARPVAPAQAAAPAPPSFPRLDLIGVAEAREGAGVVRIAVIAGPRGVQHARPGDLLEQVYRLERVTATGAELRLLPEDRLVQLGLRP